MNARLWRLIPQSRKARGVLAVFGFFAIGSALYFFIFPEKNKHTTEPVQSLEIERRAHLARLEDDADKDGLKTWEETLFRTNPEKADTDGDGISDGKEIAEGADPRDPSPNARLAPESQTGNAAQNLNEPANLTRYMTDLLRTEYVARQIAHPNPSIDPERVGETLASQTLDHFQNIAQQKKFTEKDIIVTDASDKNAAEAYIARVNALTNRTIKPLESPNAILALFMNALEKEEFEGLTALDSHVGAYSQFFTDARGISVPRDFLAIHLDYLNTAARQEKALAFMKNAERDAIGSLLAFREYLDSVERFGKIAENAALAYQKSRPRQ